MLKQITLAILLILFLASSVYASGKLFLSQDTIDLKKLTEGKIYEFSFPLENIGDSNLAIHVVVSTCGCVRILSPKSKISLAPKEKMDVKFSFNTTGLNQEVTRNLYIRSDDPENQNAKVTIKAFVEAKKEVFLKRFWSFSTLAVASAGLADGFNPCAFTVLVFFVSFLAFVGYNKRQIIILGSFFILTVFLTYLLIGLGLFEFFRRLEIFSFLANSLYILTALLAIVLGGFSLYDWWIFRTTHDPEKVKLKLPEAIKKQIQQVIRDKTDARKQKKLFESTGLKLALSAISSGFIVSILESVCTGQLYLPTIVYVMRLPYLKMRSIFYLLLYNFMFILPLVIIFVLALWGTTSEAFAKLAQKHLAKIKLITAAIFFALGFGLLAIMVINK